MDLAKKYNVGFSVQNVISKRYGWQKNGNHLFYMTSILERYSLIVYNSVLKANVPYHACVYRYSAA